MAEKQTIDPGLARSLNFARDGERSRTARPWAGLPAGVDSVTQAGPLPRRGFLGALAAAVAGGFGAGSVLLSWTGKRPDAVPVGKPIVTIHPNAVARTEEGSPRHG